MKKFKKKTAIALCVILSVILLVGLVFTFIPMTFGANTFVSFSRGISLSSDISGGLYGEYQITNSDSVSQADLTDSLATIREVFEEEGFKNVNVYALGKSKIRVQVSIPRGGKGFADAYSALNNVGSGVFSLRSEYSEDTEGVITLKGSEHVSEVSVFSNNGTNYISIKFNDAGKKIYEQICRSKDTIYLSIGSSSQGISIANVSTYDSFTLTDSEYDNLVTLEQRIKLGCMKTEVDSATSSVNTMAASLGYGEGNSSPELNGFYSSTAYIILVVALCVTIAVGMAILITKFGLFSVLVGFSFLLNVVLFMILMCLMPSVEMGLSGFLLVALMVVVTYLFVYMFADRVKKEYALGRSLQASLETAYKKQLPSIIIETITMFLSAIIFFALSFGELTSFAIIFAICSFLCAVTNLLIVPFLIKICISFEGFGIKLFKLKKRSNAFDTIELDSSEIDVSEEVGK